jgi:myo-inositol-1(or 4)-monophosphatase
MLVNRYDDLERISRALQEGAKVLNMFTPGKIASVLKHGGDPVTEADHAVDALLAEILPQPGEGWLSEETVDHHGRLDCERVWIVDPVDGTREFVEGIPEFCISIGLVENGVPVAGGIVNPSMGTTVIGSLETGVMLNDEPVSVRPLESTTGIEVLCSRSEVRRGEWDLFSDSGLECRPMGSVAYKMSLVAAGLADATWTPVPKNEWDVAAGTALVHAAGGTVFLPDGKTPEFNRPETLYPALAAVPAGIADEVKEMFARQMALI